VTTPASATDAPTPPSPASTGFGLARIGQIALTVRDLDRAVRFYRDALGIPFLFEVPRLAFLDCAGIRLMLALPEPERGEGEGDAESRRSDSVIYYRVDDIHRAYDTLRARGVPFEGEPHLIARLETHDLHMAFFRDPDGNLLALMSEVGRKREE
jgi:methylmalonyl-CoA/ethylmalonyl-CoA epimerase